MSNIKTLVTYCANKDDSDTHAQNDSCIGKNIHCNVIEKNGNKFL